MYANLYYVENKTYLIDGRGYSIQFGYKIIPPFTAGGEHVYWAGPIPPEIDVLVDAGYVTVERILTQDDSLGSGAGAVIDDLTVAPDKAWSSSKIVEEIGLAGVGSGSVYLQVPLDTFQNTIVYADENAIAKKAIANGTLDRIYLEALYICQDSLIFGGNSGNFYRPGNTVYLTGTKGQRLYLSSTTPGTFTSVAPTSGDIVLLGFFKANNVFEWNPRYILSL